MTYRLDFKAWLLLGTLFTLNSSARAADDVANSGVESPNEGAANGAEADVPLTEEQRAEQAREEFRSGQQAFAEGQFIQAARHFERANDAHPHSAVLFNMARAWHQAEELERAADAFAAAIKRGELEYEQATTAQKTLERIRTRLGWAKLSGSQGVRVQIGYHDGAELPLETHLAPGDHAINATAENGETWTQMITIDTDKPKSVVIAPPEEEPEVVTVVVPPPAVESGNRQRQMTWGYVNLGAGAALGVASAILGNAALNSKAEYEDSDPLDAQLYSQTKSLRTWTNVAAFSGLVLGATGTVLLLTLPKKQPTGEVDVGLAVGPQSISLAGRF